MGDWPLLPVVLAGPFVWACSVIERGWRVRQAERRNGLHALGRVVQRAEERG